MPEVDITNRMRRAGLSKHIADQVEDLLNTHCEEIEQDALKNDPEDEKPLKAKVSFRVEWEAGSMSPKVSTKISWTVQNKDEIEDRFEALQTKMAFDGEEESDG